MTGLRAWRKWLFLGWWRFGSSQVPFGRLSRPFSCALGHETVHSNQVVGAQGQQKQGVHRRLASDLDLPHSAGQFDPAEDLFDALATSDADRVAGCGGDLVWHKRAARGAFVLGHVGKRLHPRARIHEVLAVVAFVGPQRDLVIPFEAIDQRKRRRGFTSVEGSKPHLSIDHQPASILHQRVAQVAGLGRHEVTLASQARVGIALGAMRGVGELLPLEIPHHVLDRRRGGNRFLRGFASIRRPAGVVGVPRNTFKSFGAGPSLKKRSIHAEMLAGDETFGRGLLDDLGQEPASHVGAEQSIPVVGIHRGHPDFLVQTHIQKPTVEHAELDLLHQQPLAADAVDHLEKACLQQLLRRNRLAASRRVQIRQLAVHVPKRPVGKVLDSAKGMRPRDPGLQVHVREHLRLLGNSTAHTKIYDSFCHIAAGSIPFFSILLTE